MKKYEDLEKIHSFGFQDRKENIISSSDGFIVLSLDFKIGMKICFKLRWIDSAFCNDNYLSSCDNMIDRISLVNYYYSFNF